MCASVAISGVSAVQSWSFAWCTPEPPDARPVHTYVADGNEIVLPAVVDQSYTADAAGQPPLSLTYPARPEDPRQISVTTPLVAGQKFHPPLPWRITIDSSVRTQRPDEASYSYCPFTSVLAPSTSRLHAYG